MTKRRAPAPKLVCTKCMAPFTRWPGARCSKCGAFSTCIVTLDEARERGLPLPMTLVGDATKATRARLRTGLAGFDRILSHEGGIVPAASVLVAACPGSGKTTLLLASAGEVARGRGRRAVYASAEQDVSSLRSLGEKLGVAGRDRLLPVCVRSLGEVEAVVGTSAPALVIVDSATEIAKHSRTQPQAVVAALHEMAHSTHTSIIITAHINAAGLVRGGPELEHATDTVLMMTGDPRKSPRRELAASKNRHGDTTITTAIEMTAAGFRDVEDPPRAARRALGIGAALAVVRVDGAPSVVEVQVMIGPSCLSNPRRITTAGGLGVERLRVLVTVMEREGVIVAGDVVAQAYGGAASDPGALDAAVCAALISSSRGTPLPSGVAFTGALGLDGAVRPGDVTADDVSGLGLRLVGRPGERFVAALDRAHLSRVV